MKKSNHHRRCQSAQSTQHGHAVARREPPVRLTQSVKAPNSNLPFRAACLADRQLADIYAVRNCNVLSQALRQLREALGLKKYRVALRAGISRDMLGRVEDGRSIPTIFILTKILHGLGLTWIQFATVMDKLLAALTSDISDVRLPPVCVEMPPDENGIHQHRNSAFP